MLSRHGSPDVSLGRMAHPLQEYFQQLEEATGISDEEDLMGCLEDFTNVSLSCTRTAHPPNFQDAVSWISAARAFEKVAANDSCSKETFNTDDDTPRGVFYRKTHRIKNGSEAIGYNPIKRKQTVIVGNAG